MYMFGKKKPGNILTNINAFFGKSILFEQSSTPKKTLRYDNGTNGDKITEISLHINPANRLKLVG